MKKIRELFVRLDSAIQRKFDAFYFFLMRTFGWNKSIIRYSLFAIIITAFVGDSLILRARGVLSNMISIVSCGLVVLAFLFCQFIFFRADRIAEERGMKSRVDNWDDKAVAYVKIYFCVYVGVRLKKIYDLIMQTNLLGNQQEWLDVELLKLCFNLTFIALIYLLRTPPIPPPTKEQAKVLVPAQQSST